MKIINVLLFSLSFIPIGMQAQSSDPNLNVLVGKWKLDMSPQDKTDSNFAMMNITRIEGNSFKGEFYREGVDIKEGRVITSEGTVYAALISGDNSGTYNTSFYFMDGVLHGTTHSLDKDFLAVWNAIKISE
ncbi:MAG: hypothetical protein HRU40_02995 [Saprospiraceae bacterium]|nr:hypothetical protein [Saprospiraceae bacterium]